MSKKSNHEAVSVATALINARQLLSSRPREAAAQAREIIRHEPQIAESYILLSCALRAVGDETAAITAERQALARALDDPVIRKAQEHIEAARWPAAEELLNYYLADTPNDPVAVHLRAKIQTSIGRPEEAGRLLQRALVLAPNYAAARADLEKLFGTLGGNQMELTPLTASVEAESWFTDIPDPASDTKAIPNNTAKDSRDD